MATRDVLRPLAVFLVWMLASFLCHKLAKTALEVYLSDVAYSSPPIFASLIVTMVQLLICYASINPSSMHGSLFPVIVASHFLATLATNSSMALTFASSTMAIKMMEPMTSALIQAVVIGSSMTLDSVGGMVVVVAGALFFVGDPSQSSDLTRAVIFAVVSNLALGVRNVAMKLSHSTNSPKTQRTLKPALSLLGFAGGVGVFLCVVHVSDTNAILPESAISFLALSFASGVFHVIYSHVSTNVVLCYMSVVGHAIANIFKRVLVVLLLYVAGRRSASLRNWAGLGLCIAGLVLYNRKKLLKSSLSSSSSSSSLLFSSSSGEKLAQNGCGKESSAMPFSHNKLRFLSGLLVVLGVIFVVCLWPFTPSLPSHLHHQFPLSFQLKQELQNQRYQLLLQKQELEKNRLLLHDQYVHMVNKSQGTKDLFSKVIHSNPPHPGRSASDYALNLRFGYMNWTNNTPLLTDPVDYQPERRSGKEADEFLSRPHLLDTPLETDMLSPYLTDTRQVITEAKRIQLNLFQDLFRGKKYAVLYALASFENKGDAALSVGELVLLENLGIKLLFYVNLRKCFRRYGHVKRAMEIAAQYPKEEVVVLMHSGGNLVAHGIVDKCRELVFLASEGYDQVIMPNSFWLRDTKAEFFKFTRLYRSRPRLTVLLRDRLSLQIAKKLMPGVGRFVLCPDIAFHNGAVERYASPYYDIMWQRRVDKENAMYLEVPKFPEEVTVHVWDWMNMMSIDSSSSLEKAVNVMQNGFGILQKGRVVVTDRLHGHILSSLLDIPHVLLDNADQKLSAFHNTWTRGIKNCRLTDNVEDAARLALELLEEYKDSLPRRLESVDINENDLG